MQTEIKDDWGMVIRISNVLPYLSIYGVVFIPGGMSTRHLRFNTEFIEWIQTAQQIKYKVSVCTGALILGAAGFLEGKTATTNSSAFELLKPYCGEVSHERVIRDVNTFTAGGVTAAIDLGLYMTECLVNQDFANIVQGKLDYPYYEAGKFERNVEL